MKSKPWGEHTREDYLRMIDRQWPFWSAVDEFILENGIKSVVEVGCGIGHVCHKVDSYIGIDVNQSVLTANELFHRRGTWRCGNWLEMDGLNGELFLASQVIEHCETFQGFLSRMLSADWRFAVVTFAKGLRDHERLQDHPSGPFPENYYSRGAVGRWLAEHVNTEWFIYDLPYSRRPVQAERQSVLVMDRSWSAKLGMWKKRAVA